MFCVIKSMRFFSNKSELRTGYSFFKEAFNWVQTYGQGSTDQDPGWVGKSKNLRSRTRTKDIREIADRTGPYKFGGPLAPPCVCVLCYTEMIFLFFRNFGRVFFWWTLKMILGIFSRKMKIVWSLLSTLSFPEVWKSVGAEIFRKFWKLFCITGVILRSEPGPDGQVGRWRPRGHHTRLDKGQVQLWLNRHIEKDYRPALYKVAGLSDNIGAVLNSI